MHHLNPFPLWLAGYKWLVLLPAIKTALFQRNGVTFRPFRAIGPGGNGTFVTMPDGMVSALSFFPITLYD